MPAPGTVVDTRPGDHRAPGRASVGPTGSRVENYRMPRRPRPGLSRASDGRAPRPPRPRARPTPRGRRAAGARARRCRAGATFRPPSPRLPSTIASAPASAASSRIASATVIVRARVTGRASSPAALARSAPSWARSEAAFGFGVDRLEVERRGAVPEPGAGARHDPHERLPHRHHERGSAGEQRAGALDRRAGIGGSVIAQQDHGGSSSSRWGADPVTRRRRAEACHDARMPQLERPISPGPEDWRSLELAGCRRRPRRRGPAAFGELAGQPGGR